MSIWTGHSSRALLMHMWLMAIVVDRAYTDVTSCQYEYPSVVAKGTSHPPSHVLIIESAETDNRQIDRRNGIQIY
jgi:hypothetical protein